MPQGRKGNEGVIPGLADEETEADAMLLMNAARKNAWLPVTAAALLVFAVASSVPAVAQTGVVASIELVPVSAAGPSDTTTVLPSPLTQVDPGVSFVLEVWARTSDSNGLSSVSTTVLFDPALGVVTAVTHTMLFSELPTDNVDNAAGLVAGLSGSHLSPCADQVGVTPIWARVAVLDMQAVASGSLVIETADTGLPALGTAVCGVGDLLPAQVAYGGATLTVTASPVPTVSQWGVILLTLLLSSAATLAIARRTPDRRQSTCAESR